MVLSKNVQHIVTQFSAQPSLLRNNSEYLSRRFGLALEDVKKARKFYNDTKDLNISPDESISHYWLKKDGISAFVKKDEQKTDYKAEVEAFFKDYEPYTLEHTHTPDINGAALIISLSDLHLDKLSSFEETRSIHHGAEVIKSMAITAVQFLVGKAQKIASLAKIIIIGGNDFFQANNAKGQTEHGTFVDTQGRFQQSFRVGVELCTQIIEYCTNFAPVEFLTVLGNHSPEREFYLAHLLKRMYQHNKNVTIDDEFITRKYFTFGKSAFMLQHDLNSKKENAPLLFITEQAKMYANARFRYVLTGHLHKQYEMGFASKGENFGLIYKILPSLSCTDKWHFDNGFVGNNRACVGMLIDPNGGEFATITYTK